MNTQNVFSWRNMTNFNRFWLKKRRISRNDIGLIFTGFIKHDYKNTDLQETGASLLGM